MSTPMGHDHHSAGQGAVLLDIGDDVGALIVHLPDAFRGAEIEICPAGEVHGARPREHVGVHSRGQRGGLTAVFPALVEGRYELYRKPDGATAVVADVAGGCVQEVHWPR
jgi:hypothetical protein